MAKAAGKLIDSLPVARGAFCTARHFLLTFFSSSDLVPLLQSYSKGKKQMNSDTVFLFSKILLGEAPERVKIVEELQAAFVAACHPFDQLNRNAAVLFPEALKMVTDPERYQYTVAAGIVTSLINSSCPPTAKLPAIMTMPGELNVSILGANRRRRARALLGLRADGHNQPLVTVMVLFTPHMRNACELFQRQIKQAGIEFQQDFEKVHR